MLHDHDDHEIGLIRYHRGVMTIVDREGLLDASCECYAILRDEFEAGGE